MTTARSTFWPDVLGGIVLMGILWALFFLVGILQDPTYLRPEELSLATTDLQEAREYQRACVRADGIPHVSATGDYVEIRCRFQQEQGDE